MTGAPRRKLWLDWQRGVAVLLMIEWHVYDAWRSEEVARGAGHGLAQLAGGLAAPSFLVVAGMSQLLADAALVRRGVPVAERRRGALRRAAWLLGVAYALRLVWYLLGGAFARPGGWQDLLRVDVLNVIAVSLLASALLGVGVGGRAHVLLAAGAAAAVALLAPVVAGWEHAPSRLLDYLYAEWPRANFCLFPWAAFCLAGSALGRLALGDDRPRAWLALGALLVAAGWAADRLPPVYAHQDFWHTAPSWVAMRLGAVVAIGGALQLLPARADRWLSWLRTLGRHSLLGYFLSVELPYGGLSRPLHRRLSPAGLAVGFVATVAVTWAASAGADRWAARRRARAGGAAAGPAAGAA
jgi:uncharacterized membrane protein